MVVSSYGKRGAKLARDTIQARGLTKQGKYDIIQPSRKRYKMNVLKVGGKERIYEWIRSKKKRMSNVLTVGIYI